MGEIGVSKSDRYCWARLPGRRWHESLFSPSSDRPKVDADAEIATGVYAAHDKPADVLLWLYVLRLDLGKAKFEKYRHLALAAALVSAKEGMEADIAPREPLELAIGVDPRQPVDTMDPKRELDLNDHIINFLNEHTIEDEIDRELLLRSAATGPPLGGSGIGREGVRGEGGAEERLTF